MDNTLAVVIVAAIFAGIVIFFFTRFLGKGKFKIKTALGEVSAEGSNPTTPSPAPAGLNIKDIQAGGNIRAKDETGKGLSAEKLKADGDIDVSSSPPKT